MVCYREVEIMINLIYTPQRADFKAEYIINNDILTVTIDNKTETFDFAGLEEGIAEEIIAETLPINPVVSVEKIGDEINVTVIRFYTFEEKEEFENGNN
jgi:ribosomal protein S1